MTERRHHYCAAVVLLLAFTGAACRHARPPIIEPVRIVETVRVDVPVPVARTVPPELLAPLAVSPLPVFVAPADVAAASALTADGERRFRALLVELLARIEAWRAWATETVPP